MEGKKYSPVVQAAPAALSDSSLSIASLVEAPDPPKASCIPPVYPYTPSRQERKEYVNARLKGEAASVNEPEWVKTRKENMTSRENTARRENMARSNSRGNKFPHISAKGPQVLRSARQLSPSARPFTPPAEVPPAPKLQPLVFTDPQTPPTNGNNREAAHAAWWARVSNSLASLSARSYHLFVASSYLTCKTEELLLLYEVRKLNADGKMLFEEVVKSLKIRAASWEGTIDELRVSWDMVSRLEMVKRYDAVVAEQVEKLESELRREASKGSICDQETVADNREWNDDCAVEDSSTEASPAMTSVQSEMNVSSEDGKVSSEDGKVSLEDSKNSATVVSEEQENSTLMDSSPEKLLTNDSPFNWADDANEAFEEKCKASVENCNRREQAIGSASLGGVPLDNIPGPSLKEAYSPTWAEVVASPFPIKSYGSGAGNRWDAETSNDWDDVSGEAWEWGRNWP